MTTADPWCELEYPLTVQEVQRLQWLRGKIEAKIWLGQQQEHVSGREASRLAFALWLATTGRVSEHA